MLVLDSIVLFFLRAFKKFTTVETFSHEGADSDAVPHMTDSSDPKKLGIEYELEVDGKQTDSYSRPEPIYFDPGEKYAETDSIVTFRGDNLRTDASFGTCSIKEKKLEIVWEVPTGRLKKHYGKGYWTGSGWTGQPLIVKWDDEVKSKLNISPDKKAKQDLKEIVYSTMDGCVYFLDLDDGSATRDKIEVGLPFKGAGAVDPRRDRPIVFLGAGDGGPDGAPARALAYSLKDGSKLFEFGAEDPFKQRIFTGFDSSHIVHKGTDTLIEPGENGILYTMKMNSSVDADGNVTCNPSDVVKLRYRSNRSSEESYWLGMEDSAVLWKNYIYIADNGGNLLCIDLNTMKLIWAQDVADDTNGSPVLSVEDGVPYIYIATSLHWTASKRLRLGYVPVFKINAISGEYVWIRKYLCNTVAGISGGIQATCVLGRGDISDLVIFPIARTPSVKGGKLVAMSKKDGSEKWVLRQKHYAWSSPVAVYDEEGHAYIIQCDSVGDMMLVKGSTGEVLDCVNLGANIEASPAVYGDMVVVGTRGQKICGVRIK